MTVDSIKAVLRNRIPIGVRLSTENQSFTLDEQWLTDTAKQIIVHSSECTCAYPNPKIQDIEPSCPVHGRAWVTARERLRAILGEPPELAAEP